MKAAMMTEAGVIPGVAHFQHLNPASKLRQSSFGAADVQADVVVISS
jgi:hypothetical protein